MSHWLALITALMVQSAAPNGNYRAVERFGDREFVTYGDRLWQLVVTNGDGGKSYLEFLDILKPYSTNPRAWVLRNYEDDRGMPYRLTMKLTSFDCEAGAITELQAYAVMPNGQSQIIEPIGRYYVMPGTDTDTVVRLICARD